MTAMMGLALIGAACNPSSPDVAAQAAPGCVDGEVREFSLSELTGNDWFHLTAHAGPSLIERSVGIDTPISPGQWQVEVDVWDPGMESPDTPNEQLAVTIDGQTSAFSPDIPAGVSDPDPDDLGTITTTSPAESITFRHISSSSFDQPVSDSVYVQSVTLTCVSDLPADCGSGGEVTPLNQRRTLVSSGTERTWVLELPSSYDPDVASDVVFNLHGRGSNGVQQRVYGDFRDLAEADNVIMVYPDALAGDGGTRQWQSRQSVSTVEFDFIDDLADLISAEYCTDRFFAAGMSSGGAMSTGLACDADTRFEAFGPVTFGFYIEEECADAGPRPIIYFHGTEDNTVPFEGFGGEDFPPVPEMMQRWADHNGCDPEAIIETVSEEVDRYRWIGCEATTEWYRVEGGGHTWPGAFPIPPFGLTTDDISASDIIWDLFFG